MLGAIIGDLAAWTWENDRTEFYPRLVSERAELSPQSLLLLRMGGAFLSGNGLLRAAQCYLPEAVREGPCTGLVCSAAFGYMIEDPEELMRSVTGLLTIIPEEERQAAEFTSGLVCSLRHGATKNEAALVESNGTFRACTKNPLLNSSGSPLGTLVRAWSAFYGAFDFTSAIHNAVRLPGDAHTNAMLVGALAGAMYGSAQMMLKMKYSDGTPREIGLPEHLKSKYGNVWTETERHLWQHRTFFPKNSARTNVERHRWSPMENPLAEKEISPELRRRILKAMHTGWENRYGFYLDDGRIYVYRSFVLLARFRLHPCDDGTFRISDLEDSGEMERAEALSATREALYSVEYGWYYYGEERSPAGRDTDG